jgi:hypothetical protein
MSRIHSVASLFALIVCVVLGAACALNPIAQTAQRGSTIVIPLGGTDVATAFGGTEVSDPVRGQMVYYLQDSGGPIFELTTRASSLAAPHPASPHGRFSAIGAYQMLSVVDIPQTAPFGAHPLYARRRVDGGWVGNPIHVGQLEILPSTVTWTDSVTGSTYNVTGKSTYLPGSVQSVVPDPQILVTFAGAAYAATVSIGQNSGTYNPFQSNYEVIDVFQTDLITPNNHRPIAQLQGGPHPIAQFVAATGDPFYQIAFVFRRVNAAAPPFDLDDIYFVITRWDQNGVATEESWLFPSDEPGRVTIR